MKLQEPTFREVHAALDAFHTIDMRRWGFFRVHPRTAVVLHNGLTGERAKFASGLRRLGENFANLTSNPETRQRNVAKIRLVLERAEAKAHKAKPTVVLKELIAATSSQAALVNVTKSKPTLLQRLAQLQLGSLFRAPPVLRPAHESRH